MNRDAAAPMLLPADSPIVQKLFEHIHRWACLHHGTAALLAVLGERFWVPGGRRLTEAVVKDCTFCKRKNARERQLAPKTLTVERLLIPGEEASAQIFQDVAVDFTGPYYISMGKGRPQEKGWILIFSCMKIRVIHLESTPGIDTYDFINGLQRFMSRRGMPVATFMDNGSSFVKWAFDSLEEAAMHAFPQIKFCFKPAKAAWFGGHYEHPIVKVKSPLKYLILGAPLTDDMFVTALALAEVVVNKKPFAV